MSDRIPERDRIQAVSVVPKSEPIITQTVCSISMMPELTRPTSITVSAEEDWMAIVTTAPSTRLFHLLEVIFFRIDSRRPPAIFSR